MVYLLLCPSSLLTSSQAMLNNNASSHLDEGIEGLPVHPLELRLNVDHVDLTAGHHHSDEGVVIRP